jgi:hypothetical protein
MRKWTCKVMQKINNVYINLYNFFVWHSSPNRPKAFSLLRFLDHTQLNTHTRYNSSKRVISTSQRPLPVQHTTNTRQGTYKATMQRVCLHIVAIEKQQCILCVAVKYVKILSVAQQCFYCNFMSPVTTKRT